MTTAMYRLIEPSSQGRKNASAKIHYEALNTNKSLCGQVHVYRTVDGERMKVWYRTKRPATCTSCIKVLEIKVRKSLGGLTGDQLEDLLLHIDTFSIGLGHPQ